MTNYDLMLMKCLKNMINERNVEWNEITYARQDELSVNFLTIQNKQSYNFAC